MKRTVGVCLLNLGTPDAPEPEAVGRYLRQFLMDKWVVDLPWPLRWFLVNRLIVPKRKFASAEAYGKIWSEKGSPLLYHTLQLTEKVRARMPENVFVEPAMRYGNPSIPDALGFLRDRGVDEILVLPLYPQYAESTTRSSQEEVRRWAKRLGLKVPVSFVPPFFDDLGFIEAYAALVRRVWEEGARPEHLLFSFHGLPERHVLRTDPTGANCLKRAGCCDEMRGENRLCYRAQCFATARLIARALHLSPDRYSVSFQSRLGKTPWIKPYTDEVLEALAKKGVRRLAVACPSFTADCLETIEEIGLRGAEAFRAAGGESLVAIPCLNAHPLWVEAVVQLVRRRLPEAAPSTDRVWN